MKESWNPVVGYEEYFEVSDLGRVRYSDTKEIKSYSIDSGGYCNISLKSKAFRIHRLVAEAFIPAFKKSDVVDHINGNRQDNRLSNIRLTCPEGNSRNSKKTSSKSSSKYKGVTKRTKQRYWYARIRVGDNVINLGYYTTEEEAALAYNIAAKKHYGEFARLNDLSNCTDLPEVPVKRSLKKPVKCLNNGVIYESVHEAGRKLGLSYGSISQICRGNSKQTQGYTFRFVKEDINE